MNTRKSTAKKWTLIVLVIFVLVAIIGGTYSRYTNTESGTGEVQIAKWAVTINGDDITDDTDTFTVTFEEVENDHVVDGKIAPASQLYADFVIDPTDSEVSVDFAFELGDITVKSGSTGTVPSNLDILKVCYVENGVDGDEITIDANDKYTGTIELVDQDEALTANEAVTVRVYIEWENTDDDADNEEDTAAGIAATTLEMEITGTASQHIE